jgi:hypothetical protein
MKAPHFLMLAVALVAGYVAARYFPKPGQAVGLP